MEKRNIKLWKLIPVAILFFVLISCIIFEILNPNKEIKNEAVGKVDPSIAIDENFNNVKVNNESNTSNIVNNNQENNNTINTATLKDSTLEAKATTVNIIKDIKNISNNELEEIVKNTLNEYYEFERYEKSSIGPGIGLLTELGLISEEDADYFMQESRKNQKDTKTNIKYEKFKKALLQYVTEDYFIKFFCQYKNVDGYVTFVDSAGGVPWITYEKATLKSKNGNKYIFEVDCIDMEIYNINIEDGESVDGSKFKIDVGFEYVEDRLVISELNGQIILEGVYGLEASDVAYVFYKNGDVEYSTNTTIHKGTYIQSGENEVRITWEEKITYDDTNKEEIIEIEEDEDVQIIDDKTLYIIPDANSGKEADTYIKFEN